MIKLNVNLVERSYPIYIDFAYGNIVKAMATAKINSKVALITDTNVDKFQSGDLLDVLQAAGYEVYKYVFEAGEKSKNLDTVKNIYKFLLDAKMERNSTLIALGGGVVGDITGFAAATYLRGVNFIQVPTTTLAQADSSVGGKVGVDFEGAKNMVGAFYQPNLVYINVNSLRTLPKREFISGLGEVIKHGIIMDAEFFDYIDYNTKKILNCDETILQYMTKTNCSIKGHVVEQDERESDLRAILNFGHTIGHAVESVLNFELLHGECISIGMVGACKIAQYLNLLDEGVVKKIVNLIKNVGLPVRLGGIDADKVYEQMFYDKKVKDKKLVFVLPKGIGEVIQLNVDNTELIKKVISELG
jgi:3-dehydroquinate synthase